MYIVCENVFIEHHHGIEIGIYLRIVGGAVYEKNSEIESHRDCGNGIGIKRYIQQGIDGGNKIEEF
jgi:hypothetical protein